MDHQRFDALARCWATRRSRRTALKVLAGGGILGFAGRRDAMADECKRADKPCKKNSQCCDGLVCAAGRCQDLANLTPCANDGDCPFTTQVICGSTKELVEVDNPCLDGFCAVSSPPPEDPCCQCRAGGACDVSEGSCCAAEQVCQDKKGNEFCCPGTDYCGTDRKGEAVCLTSDRACLPEDTTRCVSGESCAGGVCCPENRACPGACCDFYCYCDQVADICVCPLQAGIRRI